MLHDLTVSKSVIVHASPVKVWEALTNPEIIREYLFGTETITDWIVGNPITFQGEYDGQTYKDHGIILENIPLTKLSYSYWSAFTGLEDKQENYSIVSYELKKKGTNQTEFTWSQKGYSSEEAYHHSEDGMDEFLKSIKSIIEK
jgi:uncharacterized protein YndB with AHSA1/START domain